MSRSHRKRLAEPEFQLRSSWLWRLCPFYYLKLHRRFGDLKTDIAPRPRWGTRDGKKADFSQLGSEVCRTLPT